MQLEMTRGRKNDHRFYTGMAFAMFAGVIAGFTPSYFARSHFHSPAIPLFVHIHGAVFTAWMLFYLAQNLLAMNGGMALHRRLGITGAILGAAVVVLGLGVAIRQTMQGRFLPFPDLYSSLAISTAQMLLFGVMIGLALWLRRDSETHKRLILVANQLFFFPAFGRVLGGIGPATLLLAFCFYFAGPLYDWLTRKSIHRAYRWGVPLLILTMPPFTLLASRAWPWRHFVDWLTARA